MEISYRDMDLERDAEAITALVTRTGMPPITAEVFKEHVNAWPEGYPNLRRVAEADGELCAYLRIGRESDNQKNAFLTSIYVDHDHRRRGIGSALYDVVQEFADQERAGVLVSVLKGDQPDSIRFAESRGFVKVAELFDSYLDLTSLDLSSHMHAVDRAEADGIRFAALSEFDLTEETKRAFYEAFISADRDTPSSEYFGIETWPVFEALFFNSKSMDLDAVTVAVRGDQFVGFTNVETSEAGKPGEMQTGFTGVIPSERGKGIAYGVKVKSLQHCLDQGGRRLKTENDTRNQPMLTINRRFGFEEQTGEYVYVRELEQD